MVNSLEKLIKTISKLKDKDINEAQTKDYLIRPFFESLGWDFSNPDEVIPEESDSSGKRPDYSFYIGGSPKILIEAKPLNNQLNDVKMINEKMSYCLSTQVPFLIITNGVLYRIYYSKLDGANKDKLLFDFQLDENVDEELINKLRKDSVAKDELLNYAQNTFVLTNVKKTLEALFQDPPKKYLNIITEKMKETIGYTFGDNDLKDALQHFNIQINTDIAFDQNDVTVSDAKPDQKNWTIERQFNDGKWDTSFDIYKKLIALLVSEGIKFEENPTKLYIGLISKVNNKNFCQVQGQKRCIKIWINTELSDLTEQEKLLIRDVSNIGHHGIGKIEATINSIADLGWCVNIIKKSTVSP
ncbi:MAG: type I restriction enzyme HsdR N-terminal domain-containing protein [Treponema sp.]|nr:type I restriction enzyme HsdR N-terminal domain-containing protein [Treponema sp.]